MNFSKPIAIALLVFVIAFVSFPQSSADGIEQAKDSVSMFFADLG